MDMHRRLYLQGLAAAPFGALKPAQGQAAVAAEATSPSTVLDDIWHDAARQRSVPVRIRWPAADAPGGRGGRAVVLFSHGLGGTVAAGERWGQAWSAAGLVVLHLQQQSHQQRRWCRIAQTLWYRYRVAVAV